MASQKPKLNPKPSGQAAPVPKSEEGRSLTLYELTGSYAELAVLLDQTEDPDQEEKLTELLSTFKGEIKERVDYLGRVIAQKNAEAEWILEQSKKFSDEATRLKNRAGVRTNGIERLRDFIKDCLSEFGSETQKVEGPTFTTTLSKEGDATVEVVNETEVPNEFKEATLKMPLTKVPPNMKAEYLHSTRIDKTAINQTLKEDGVIPPGCKPGPRKRTLRQY